MILSGSAESGRDTASYTITIDDISGNLTAYSLANATKEDVIAAVKKDAATELSAEVRKDSAQKTISISLAAKDRFSAFDMEARGKVVKRVLFRVGSPTLKKL